MKGTEEGFSPAEGLKHGLPVSVETVVPGTIEIEVACERQRLVVADTAATRRTGLLRGQAVALCRS